MHLGAASMLGATGANASKNRIPGNYDVLAMVHNETSTGVMSNLQEISDMLKTKYPDVIILVHPE